jgi:hypothetical protein
MSKANVGDRAVVDGFLLGMPKCGTTWLANILAQNSSIDFSDPKEPNIIASHRGTFGRDAGEPDLEAYGKVFSGSGFRVDGSVHTFSCPLSPSRVYAVNPKARFVICLREPVGRAFSHWKMVRDGRADRRNGVDWSDFEIAWGDQRLKDDSMWSDSMSRWLEKFKIESFLLIDSERMRGKPEEVLGEVTSHFGLPRYNYDFKATREANTSRSRRGMTHLGSVFREVVRLIPQSIRGSLARPLQKRSLNIYDLPLISKRGESSTLTEEYYRMCAKEVVPDMEKFEAITGFHTQHWLDLFR